MSVARKRFGQHFLHDQSVLERIAEAVAPQAADRLVEIGPGRGALTTRLLRRHPALDVIEIDRDLVAELRAQFATTPGLVIHSADALRFNFADLATQRGGPLRVIGNLPYNISTPLLFHLLEQRAALVDLHVMLQKEVVERMAAAPNTEHYGRLTVMLAPWTEITLLFDVGPGAFSPPPRVWSAVARVAIRREPAFPVAPPFAQVVAAAFAQRRKTLRNALRNVLDARTLEDCGIDPGARAETLAPADFGRLATAITAQRDSAAAESGTVASELPLNP
jgi:16S rRNA (adenine1518-N6/adenine1519-N6)-dimethyltransferase